MSQIINPKDPVTESAPKDWTATQEIIAKDALTILSRHYPSYKWGVEWTESINSQLGVLLVRLLDIPTDVVYVVHPKDMDRDNMRCIMRAGGEMLEALGLRAGRARGDDVRGLKRTPTGLIVPDYAAVPESNPGYDKIKAQYSKLR